MKRKEEMLALWNAHVLLKPEWNGFEWMNEWMNMLVSIYHWDDLRTIRCAGRVHTIFTLVLNFHPLSLPITSEDDKLVFIHQHPQIQFILSKFIDNTPKLSIFFLLHNYQILWMFEVKIKYFGCSKHFFFAIDFCL